MRTGLLDGHAAEEVVQLVLASLRVVQVVIFNDNSYGNVKLLQNKFYKGRTIASDLSSPNFVQVAQSFGAQGLQATTPAELRSCLAKAFDKTSGPTVIVVPVGDFPSPWGIIKKPRVR